MANSKLENLNLSQEELTKIGKAFQDDTFRDLFRQYLHEINDPINRKIYEDEITQMEKEQGRDIAFIKPNPGYVLKTLSNGNTKTYINFCTNEIVAKYSSLKSESNTPGIQLSIPYSVSPSKHNEKGHYYTVVFHPDTLKYAEKTKSVKKLVQDTAFDAIEQTYNISLDRTNISSSKKSFKGVLECTIVRRQTSEITKSSDFLEPKFVIKYRNEVDLQNCRNGVYSKMNSLVPKYILIDIDLPLLKSIDNTTLDIKPSSLHLLSDEPKYKLTLPLNYEVDENQSSAKFDSNSHILKLELLVKPKNHVKKQPQSEPTLITEIGDQLTTLSVDEKEPIDDTFLRSDIKYKFPEYFCNYYQNKIVFVLKVKNVSYDSFKYRVVDNRKGCIMKFSTLGAGHFPMYYSFCVAFADNKLRVDEPLQHVIEDENVYVYLYLQDNNVPLEYFVGSDPDNVEKVYLNEPDAVPLENNDNKEQILDVQLQVTKFTSQEVQIDLKASKNVSTSPKSDTKESKKSDKSSVDDRERIQTKFLDSINFSQFCTKPRSTSESEIVSGSLSDSKETNSNSDNHSWIIENKGVKKSRKKRQLEKKLNGWLSGEAKSETEDQENVFTEGTQPIDIKSAYKYADLSSRSILKKSRSFSESSGDELIHYEYRRSLSIDDINFSSDSCSTSVPKKSVTFNDVISKKLYSSNISILEQRKRARRHSQRKERRASESDNSESETNTKNRQDNVRFHNANLYQENSENELTSVSESGETSDDQSDAHENAPKMQNIPCSKKNHKRRGKKSARKNASMAKHQVQDD